MIITMSKTNIARIEALWGSFIGDALAMPVHWFYNPPDIKRICGDWIRGFVAPPARHPTCILTVSATDSSGRSAGGSGKPVIGNIILHDKLKYWQGQDRTVHYHQGMAPGDNTLNSQCAIRIMDVLVNEDPNRKKPLHELRQAALERYVNFMTTPGSHNDTYAESWHRLIFRDWSALNPAPKSGAALMDFFESRSKRLEQGRPDGQIPHVGALVCAVPWVVHYAEESEDRAAEAAIEFVRLTHPANGFPAFVDLYVRSLHRVMNGKPVKEVSRAALMSPELGFSSSQIEKLVSHVSGLERGSESELEAYQDIVSSLGMACYIKGALSVLFFISHQFHDNYKDGILMNVNVGGENCHRGAALGALLGAGSAYPPSNSIPEEFKSGLNSISSEWSRVRSEL